jgi:hypothetical protein
MADVSPELEQELNRLQGAYKAAVDAWVAAIREEERLASGNHDVAELDAWEGAHFREHKLQREADYGSASMKTRCASNFSASDP